MSRLSSALFLLIPMLLATEAPAQITTEQVATGFVKPVHVAAPAGDAERVFVVETRGLIRIVKNGTVLARPFLDIQDKVNDSFNEQGLLGLCFDPDFDTNNYFYVYFTNGSGAGSSVIRRFTVSSDPDSADIDSLHRVMRIQQTQVNHNGGHIQFSPIDGYLYVGMGDGGGANDGPNHGQRGDVLLGKMLRIDPDGDDFPADSLQNYAIPPTNPFVGDPSTLDEIWARGTRNPYRWSFDRDTGDLYIADVGQECWEEISFQPASSTGGENYGWRLTEGFHCFDPAQSFNCNQPTNCSAGLVDPIYEFSSGSGSGACSVTGGYVYRGDAIPAIQGHYFFVDYCKDDFFSFKYDGANLTELTDWTAELDGPTYTINSVTSFGEDGLGEMYILDQGGQLYKIIADPTSVSPNPAASSFSLSAGRPNPFSQVTQFQVTLEDAASLDVSVYSAAGRLVTKLYDNHANAGVLPIEWRGRDGQGQPLPSGVYFIRARVGDQVTTKQVTLVR